METDVLKTLKYFSFFDYSPRFEEIFVFLNRKTTIKNLKKTLNSLIRLKRLSIKDNRYTLGEYIDKEKWREDRVVITRHKLQKAIRFLTLVSMFSQIKLVGLSGSAAMANAKKEDDIDFFVITAQNRLWTGRFVALIIASLFGRRKFNDAHTSDKLCLNLFFDEKNLKIGTKKRTYYVAHEVLQMKPLINKGKTYERFLEANKWVFKIFPNSRLMFSNASLKNASNLSVGDRGKTWQPHMTFYKSTFFEHLHNNVIPNSFQDLTEKILKKLQLFLINRHKTTELISDTQLWFFPDDFERKLQNR